MRGFLSRKPRTTKNYHSGCIAGSPVPVPSTDSVSFAKKGTGKARPLQSDRPFLFPLFFHSREKKKRRKNENRIKAMTFSTVFQNIIKLLAKYWDVFLIKGVSITLALSAITVFFGAILGSLLALMKMSPLKLLRFLVTAFVEVIRGTPMLLQLYVGYFIVPLLVPSLGLGTFASISVALVINSAAYVSEIIRSGIQAVDPGQGEAARSLGLSKAQTMSKVILPQAVKNILPALGNEFVTIIKETSLASTFFVGDLMTSYLIVKGATYLAFESLIIVGVIYFVLTFSLSKLIGVYERRLKQSD